MRFRFEHVIGATLLLCTVAASAQTLWGHVDAKVTYIDATNLGTMSPYGAMYFSVDQPVGTPGCGSYPAPSNRCCPAGTPLVYVPRSFGGATADEAMRQAANTRAVLSTVQLALTTGYKVRLYGYDQVVISGMTLTGTCQVVIVGLFNN